MKTPREILLARHQAAAPKLDAIRHAVVESTRRPSHLRWPILLWRELVWPCRRIWTGLAAVWILILAANVSLHEHSPAIARSGPSSEMMTTLKDQQTVLAELLGDHAVPPDADRPKIFSPKPRTENAEIWAV